MASKGVLLGLSLCAATMPLSAKTPPSDPAERYLFCVMDSVLEFSKTHDAPSEVVQLARGNCQPLREPALQWLTYEFISEHPTTSLNEMQIRSNTEGVWERALLAKAMAVALEQQSKK